jgi:hypothetical protein
MLAHLLAVYLDNAPLRSSRPKVFAFRKNARPGHPFTGW